MSKKFQVAGNVLLVLSALAGGVYLARRPWEEAMRQKEIAETAQRDMHLAEAHYADDRKRESRINSRIGREERVREMGFRKPGEVRLPD